MQFLGTVALFPLLFWLLTLGCGLLVERLTGARIAGLLILPLGFVTLIVVSQFTLWWGPTAPLTPWVLLVLALLGFVFARGGLRGRWRARSRGWWLSLAPGLATYLLVAAPEIAAGRPTFSGYLLDTTGAIQVAGAERLLHHAHSFLPGVPAYGTTLTAYFGNAYPSGGHGVLAAVGWLSGQDLIWLYSIFQALELGMLALVLAYIARRAGLSRVGAAIAGTLAAAPALVYAYALMGSIKEITALPAIVLMGALIACASRLRREAGLRAVLPFALAAAAALDSIGIAASPWVLLFGAMALVAVLAPALVASVPRVRARELTHFALGGAALAACTALVGLPTVGPLSKTLGLAESVSNADPKAVADPGNLLRPLKFFQTLGVWLGESHRIEPKYVNQTYILLGIMVVCIALGAIWLVRRRSWSVLAFVLGSLLVWYALHRHATTWTDAKLLVILSPAIVLVALIGAFGLAQVRRTEGTVLVVLVALGILLSDGLLYHGTNLAPTQRYAEIATIDTRFAHQRPTLAPDFDEYVFPTLSAMEVDSPGLAYAGQFEFIAGVTRMYGHSYDLDTIALPSVERFRTIVMRRSPGRSRPPGNFTLQWKGRFYAVWRRDGAVPREHVALGGSGFEPASQVSCRQLAPVAQRAERLGARIAFAERPLNVQADLASAARSAYVGLASDLDGRPQLLFGGPARVEGHFRVTRGGRYDAWLGGSVDRPLQVLVDGRPIAAPSAQSGGDGNMIHLSNLTLSAGRHTFALIRGGGDLRPDDAGSTVIDGLVFEAAGAEDEPVKSVAARAWHSLCGRSLDWIEIA
jgi:hypothetical protein